MVHTKSILGKKACVSPVSGKGKSTCGSAFAQGPGCIWKVTREDGEVHCVPQDDLASGKHRQLMINDVNFC